MILVIFFFFLFNVIEIILQASESFIDATFYILLQFYSNPSSLKELMKD